jgi:Zn-dependent M28 family amino/carboxypeptidase
VPLLGPPLTRHRTAAGTKGGEMLFQATSDEMIAAYARVPHPMGTIVASDVFKSGIMLSECVRAGYMRAPR